jgi:hypothetical protein
MNAENNPFVCRSSQGKPLRGEDVNPAIGAIVDEGVGV